MSDGLPTEEQLQRMERTVLGRIRRRAALPKRIATGAAAVALVAGGVFLVPRLGLSGGSSGSAASGGGGSTGQYGESDSNGATSGGGSGALLAACHATPTASGAERRVPVSADSAAAAIDACLASIVRGQVPRPTPSGTNDLAGKPLTAKDLVACRDADGLLQVFVKDEHPSTLCRRNGMTVP